MLDNEEIIDVNYESIEEKEEQGELTENNIEIIENFNYNEKSILNKSRDIILTSYDITSTANKIYNAILYSVQKEKNGHYKCKMKSKEIMGLIKKKDNKNINYIKDILSTLKGTSLLFWDKEGNKNVENDYNLIIGRKYIVEDDMFEIEVPDVVYNHITKYKCYAPLNLDILSQFKSFYAQRMYELLRLWSRYNRTVEHKFSVNELRFVLGVGEKYPRYNNFKQKVLEVCKKELKEKANMNIEFEAKKTGRSTTHIIIRILDKEIKKYFPYKRLEEIKKIDLSGLNEDDIKIINSMIKNLENKIQDINKYDLKKEINNIKDYIFNKKAILEKEDVYKILKLLEEENINEKQAKELLEEANFDIEHIKKVYSYVRDMKEKNKITTTVFAYLKSLVAPGVFKEPEKKEKNLRFNNFKQREYDYDSLEKKLLGWDNDEDEDMLPGDIENSEENNSFENELANNDENENVVSPGDIENNDNISINFENLKLILEEQLISLFGEVSYATWLKYGVDNIELLNNKVIFECQNEFTEKLVNERYKLNIVEILKVIDEQLELEIRLKK